MTIVILEPASSGVELARAAHELGWPVAVLTGPQGDRKACGACRELGSSLHSVDTSNVVALLSTLETIPEIRAILPGMEYYVETTARLADSLSLPGIGADVARRFRNKHEMRRRLAERGVATPAFSLLPSDPAAGAMTAAKVGFPCVLKPVDGAGSIGVTRIDTAEDLTRALVAIPSGDFHDLGYTVGGNWMIESYIPGPEFSLEGVITDAGPHIIAVTEKILGPEPYFVEMGHIVEADISRADRFSLVSCAKQAITALGLPLGVFHAELRLSPDGPRLIEVAARLGGDRIPRLVNLACGVSLARLALLSHCYGRISQAEFGKIEVKSWAGIRFFTAADIGSDAGAFQQVTRARHGILEAELDPVVPDSRPAAVGDFRDRIGHVVCSADSHRGVSALLRETTISLPTARQARAA